MKFFKRWLPPLLVLACVAVGMALLGSAVSHTDAIVGERRAAAARIDAFLAQPPADVYENTAALDGFAAASAGKPAQSDAPHVYAAPEGFLMKSYSDSWDAEKLRLLYQELKKNKHGDEMSYLHEVVVYAHKEDTILGTHRQLYAGKRLTFDFPALPPTFYINFHVQSGIISLYGGDTNQTIESMAKSLSHEYGHHYTHHYMLPSIGGGQPVRLDQTEYAKVRGLVGDPRVKLEVEDWDAYLEEHHGDLVEIAAEDYVQLMGSPTVHRVVDFPDVREQNAGVKPPESDLYNQATNFLPQENLMLPLATQVEGLAAYFYSFIDAPPPSMAPGVSFAPRIEKGSKTYNLVSGRKTFVHYKITWDTPYPDAVYTLVCYDASDYQPYPVKTVEAGEKAEAYIGTVTRSSATRIWYMDDKQASGVKTFRVIAVMPDAGVYISDPLVHEF